MTLNLLILGYFKYYNFLAEVLNPLLRGFDIALPAIQVTLPIGDFLLYLPGASYVVDFVPGRKSGTENPLNMMLYISFFPQLIAGPIVKYHDIEEQIENRTVTLESFSYGVKRFILVWERRSFWQIPLLSGGRGLRVSGGGCEPGDARLTALLICCRFISIFLAIRTWRLGLEKCLALHLLKTSGCRTQRLRSRISGGNGIFPSPAGLKSTCTFRSAETGGSTARTYVNLWTVFLLTGIWHGAGWTFIFWGIYHGFFNVLERCFLGKWLKQEKFRPLAHIYAVFVVLIELDFLPRGHDRAGIFLYPVYVCAAQRSRSDGTLRTGNCWMFLAAALLACGQCSGSDEMERARAGAGWLGDGHKLDRLHGDPVVFHFAACQQYIQSIYLFPFLNAV